MDAVSDKFQIMTDIQLYLNKVQPYHMWAHVAAMFNNAKGMSLVKDIIWTSKVVKMEMNES